LQFPGKNRLRDFSGGILLLRDMTPIFAVSRGCLLDMQAVYLCRPEKNNG
jgi:hypothetical protein